MNNPRSTRDVLLDAFETILIDNGERSATLEAVAAEAGVSKGGLLYHFGSKNDLVDGEIQRLKKLANDDFDRLRDAPDGVVSRFLRSSVVVDSPFDRAFVIVTRLAQSGRYPAVTTALEEIEGTWLDMLTEALGDPVVAQIVLLMSDGLYYQSALFPTPETVKPNVDELLGAIDQLIAARASAPR